MTKRIKEAKKDTIVGAGFECSHEPTKGIGSVLAVLVDVQYKRVFGIDSLRVE